MNILRLPPPIRSQLYRSLHTATHTAPPDLPTSLLLPSSPALLTLTPSTLNSYQISLPPQPYHLRYAHTFFASAPPSYLFTAANFRSFPPSPHPEIAFLGRSNVGKSSLLNALFGRTNIKDAYVSKRPGRTRTMNGFGVTGGIPLGKAPEEGERKEAWRRFPRGGVVVVDMPGYGGGSREDWGKEIMKVLEGRKQLRRTFVLVDAEHGLKGTDVQLLMHLRQQGIAHQIILSKVDKLLYPSAKPPGPQRLSNGLLKVRDLCTGIRRHLDQEAVKAGHRGRDTLLDILCCSSEKGLDEKNRHRKLGIDEVRWAVLSACGLECDEQGNRKKMLMRDIKILEDDEDLKNLAAGVQCLRPECA
ncbi:hypothetical protein LTR56_010480 [Elasticomyces elasticus]|nr:hypothetical protein LTR56_010480 [Elasticomyces elasticus]KAK3657896.1 hypothetical protein LTR22_009123 [Elasticomyces elasticus]KAK4917582.1 hypothetical protein LTR49_014536 [Elasticomyces elasticus]KAK5762802.1 hypothetical protein LTS12_006991 [Elasticomyces elasticus]